MFEILENGNGVTIGTMCSEPDMFTYQIFKMGVKNLETDQENLSSVLDLDAVNDKFALEVKELVPRVDEITRRAKGKTSIYDIYTCKECDGKKITEQIVIDAECADGKLLLRFNNQLRKELLALKGLYEKEC